MSKSWLTFSFWFNSHPATDFPLKKPILIFACSLLLLSFLCLTIFYILFKNSKAYSILREEIFYFLFAVSLLLLLAWFFRSQGLVYLSAPVVFLLVGLIALAWFFHLIRLFLKKFLPLLREEKNWQRKLKYLPKGKK